ncbi:hypothetical protein Q8G46_27635, partial [Klebsiella pneumoniae]|uniref:hypothetical protein n=1 Tax=Klebsiella pneumoniae TaxID=573 RepID=UPI003013C717
PGLIFLTFLSNFKLLANWLLQWLLLRLPLILSPQNPLSPLLTKPLLTFAKRVLDFNVTQHKSIGNDSHNTAIPKIRNPR